MTTARQFDDSAHPRGGNQANRGQFSQAGPQDHQPGYLDPHDGTAAVEPARLDPYGRPDHCRWNEWYWTVRPAAVTHRDELGLSDAEYNATFRADAPPPPRADRRVLVPVRPGSRRHR